ncbi:cell division protein FtsW [Methylohalomonas lacus]|uniref:Probable peptidoglycan glycosyltransferase FtsW n=1 Tax=Methylohalomonas lacus TaxID=398773 RepID=A0AAE3HKT2_9GAMM|nr:putative lipid II flippase FtsW [Methylohalomonas lacus]MCS3902252.1 cell division protein FtsW [Methylohalomonas lacus]
MSAVLKRQQAAPGPATRRTPATPLAGYDPWLLGVALLLLALGLVMVASASITIADRSFDAPLHYFWRQSFAAVLGIALAAAAMRLPLKLWEQTSLALLLAGLGLLLLVLIPGLGVEINGAMRWIRLGPVNLQASEPVKLCVIVYMAGYLVRQAEAMRATLSGFIRPVLVLTLVAALLLLQPDYGAAVVLFATGLGMMFLGGVPLGRFFAWMGVAAAALISLAILSPYRMQRLMSFTDPWQDPYNTGFQLTQALIAFGRGDWFGVGLGGSVQKLFYLPEAHTDFVYSVIAEELGFVGSTVVILLFCFIVRRAFTIGQLAIQAGQAFAAYLAYGIGLLIGIQTFINIGVNMGILPTKGLTLPLLSYGSNSLVITCLMIGLLLRIDYETRNSTRARVPAKAGRHGG